MNLQEDSRNHHDDDLSLYWDLKMGTVPAVINAILVIAVCFIMACLLLRT